MQFGPVGAHLALDIVTGRHAIGIQILGRFQQILELHPFVTADAGNGRGPAQIAIGEFVNHGVLEHVFIIQNVMREPHGFRDTPRIMDIDARTASPFARQCRTVVVKLQGDADDVIAFLGQHGGDHGTVDTARHRHNDAGVGRCFGKAQRIERRGAIKRHENTPGGLSLNIGKLAVLSRGDFTGR